MGIKIRSWEIKDLRWLHPKSNEMKEKSTPQKSGVRSLVPELSKELKCSLLKVYRIQTQLRFI